MAEALNGRKRQDPTGNSFFLADIYANAGLYLTGIPNISGSKILYLDPITGRVSYADASGSTTVSASYALTASYLEGTIASASFATSASYALSSSFAQTARSASFASTSSYVAAPGSTTQVVFNNLGALSASSGFVFNAGNVGIGTASPGTKLVVAGGDDAAGVGVLEIQTAGGTNLKIGGNTTYSWIQSHASKPLYINQLGNNVILNSGGGNVGIGELSPTARLEVKGSGITSATTAFRVENANVSASMVVLDDGNVGIGTTSPTLAKLQVQGNVSASSYTGSLFGTASFATNATSASFASTASYVLQAISASFANNATSASYALTASYVRIAESASFAPNLYNTDGTLPNSTRTVTFLSSTILRFDLSSSVAGSPRVLFDTSNATSGVRFTGSGYVNLDTAGVSLAGVPNLAQANIVGRDSLGVLTYFATSSIKLVQSASYAVTASYFSGSIANAILADSASRVLVVYDDQPLASDVFYLTYARPVSGTYEFLLNDRSLRYDSGIRTLYATNFSGAFSGSLFGTAATASYAPNIYNSNGALSSSRLVDLNGQDLTFNADGGDFIIISNPTNTVSIEALTTGSAPNLIFQTPGDGKLFTSPTSSFTASFAVSASFANTASHFLGTFNRIVTGSITASVNVGSNIFLIQSSSFTPFSITNQGSTTISSSAADMFLVRNSSNNIAFKVSQSGVIVLATQSVVLSDPAPAGGIYFTSASFYVALD